MEKEKEENTTTMSVRLQWQQASLSNHRVWLVVKRAPRAQPQDNKRARHATLTLSCKRTPFTSRERKQEQATTTPASQERKSEEKYPLA